MKEISPSESVYIIDTFYQSFLRLTSIPVTYPAAFSCIKNSFDKSSRGNIESCRSEVKGGLKTLHIWSKNIFSSRVLLIHYMRLIYDTIVKK